MSSNPILRPHLGVHMGLSSAWSAQSLFLGIVFQISQGNSLLCWGCSVGNYLVAIIYVWSRADA